MLHATCAKILDPIPLQQWPVLRAAVHAGQGDRAARGDCFNATEMECITLILPPRTPILQIYTRHPIEIRGLHPFLIKNVKRMGHPPTHPTYLVGMSGESIWVCSRIEVRNRAMISYSEKLKLP